MGSLQVGLQFPPSTSNRHDMAELDTHLQCQSCHVRFETNEALCRHLETFKIWATRIRTWGEQCQAHIEPRIEDPGEDDLDIELCRDYPALLHARVCPVEGCNKEFSKKKRLNIHFESRNVSYPFSLPNLGD
ncbi:hypothetical protein BR93DRAFT_392635 [Coniochaeta sp. PMI_546]|nr:hypothetical protein BR93DRAFT_392635 [Coniochaeta sp. PMI_546]